jgi:glycosyltransferase involved in cell wall biosynthesis
MGGLVEALAVQGASSVFIAEQMNSVDRIALGWQPHAFRSVQLHLMPDAGAVARLVGDAPSNSIHICQGFRGNGLVNVALYELARRRLRQWVIMETVDDAGWRGLLRRREYARLIQIWRNSIEGILAIGHATPQWLVARGMPAEKVFPFAYFLPDRSAPEGLPFDATKPFRFLYVGQYIKRKRIDLLINALAMLPNQEFELTLVGCGPLQESLRTLASKRIPGRTRWLTTQPMDEIPALMANADCLVLPSRHDGWGAVVSEALMVGTPAICSDSCGAAGVVQLSGSGGVFPSGDVMALTKLLCCALAKGRQTTDMRLRLATWSRCLGASAGAHYLEAILHHTQDGGRRPEATWTSAGAQFVHDDSG